MKRPFAWYILLIAQWLGLSLAHAQDDSVVLNDLVFVIEQSFNREQVLTAMQQFRANTEVGLSVTTVFDGGVYTTSARHAEADWLKRELGLSLFITLDRDKAYQRCVMQVTPAVESLLPAEDRQRILQKFMEYYFRGDFTPDDAFTQGMLVGIKAMEELILKNKGRQESGLLASSVTDAAPDTSGPTQYKLPLRAYVDDDYYLIDPEKTEFGHQDTIAIDAHMAGFTLFLEDNMYEVIELSSDNFVGVQGLPWSPGFTIDIEDLPQDSVMSFSIVVPAVDTLQMYLLKSGSEAEMTEPDIVSLLSAISEASENEDTSFDLSEYLYFMAYRFVSGQRSGI